MSAKLENTHLRKLRDGSLGSFKWIYLKYHSRVYCFCVELSGDRQAAEEITEDVFVRLWTKREMIDPDLGISGLLFKMTRDYAWNFLKSNAKRQVSRKAYIQDQPLGSNADIESDLILEDYLTIAEEGIRQLPDKCRQAFNLRYKKGLDNREIAQQLSISEVTVRVHLFKAVRFLRNYIKAHPELPFNGMVLFLSLPAQ